MSLHYVCRQKRVKKVPVSHHGFMMPNLIKGDKVKQMKDPSFIPDILLPQECMPIHFRSLPFGFEIDHAESEKIQKILQYSLKQQKEEDVSHCSGFVSHVIQSCLGAIGIPSKLEMGFRVIQGDQSPLVWLNVDGRIVDTAYEKYLSKYQISVLEETTPKCYQPKAFTYPCNMPSDKDEFAEICYQKGLETFLHEPDKGSAQILNYEQLYIYFFSMVRFMSEAFGVTVPIMHPAVRHYCWGCGLFPEHSSELLTDILPDGFREVKSVSPVDDGQHEFKQCSQCIVASYCSLTCQKSDWDRQHRFICVPRLSGPAS